MNRAILLILSALVLSSCATLNKFVTAPVYLPVEEQLNDRWYGSTYAEIVREFGAPVRSVDDGLNGSILVYEETQTEYSSYSTNGMMGGNINTRTEALTYRTYTEFYLDADRVCYHVRSNRLEENGRRFSPLRAVATGVVTGSIGFVLAMVVTAII